MDKNVIDQIKKTFISFVPNHEILDLGCNNINCNLVNIFNLNTYEKKMLNIIDKTYDIPDIDLYLFINEIFHYFEYIHKNVIFINFLSYMVLNKIINIKIDYKIVLYNLILLLPFPKKPLKDYLIILTYNKLGILLIKELINISIRHTHKNVSIKKCENCNKYLFENIITCNYCKCTYYCNKKCLYKHRKTHYRICFIYINLFINSDYIYDLI